MDFIMKESAVNNNEFPYGALNSAEGPDTPVKATLKWFNKTKGFGFVIPDDYSHFNEDAGDAFIHITALFEAKCEHLGEGATFMCVIDEGPKGLIVRKITEILSKGDPGSGTNLDHPASRFDRDKGFRENSDETLELKGKVKWYRPEKGFGFIIPEDGEKDVFIHRQCLKEQGLDRLDPGQPVKMLVRSAPKGREVVSFKFRD